MVWDFTILIPVTGHKYQMTPASSVLGSPGLSTPTTWLASFTPLPPGTYCPARGLTGSPGEGCVYLVVELIGGRRSTFLQNQRFEPQSRYSGTHTSSCMRMTGRELLGRAMS